MQIKNLIFLLLSSLVVDMSMAKVDDSLVPETVRIYSGWAAIKKEVIDPSADVDEWLAFRELRIEDNGNKLRLRNSEMDTPYELELIVINKAITYIWGEPGAHRLGMNLRWMQAGFTLID